MTRSLWERTARQESILKKKYRPGEIVPDSGVYRVIHDSHRLMHEATLLKGEKFPLCRTCKFDVRFDLRRAVQDPTKITSHHAILEDYPDPEPFVAT